MTGLLALGLLTGCDGSAPRASPPTTPSPSASASPSTQVSPSASAAATAIPDGFPLTQGLAEDYEQITGPAPDAPRIRLVSVCGLRDWSSRARDRLAVQAIGPEASETRELVVFRSGTAARAAVRRVAGAVARCPQQTGVPASRASRFRLFQQLDGAPAHPVTAFAETLADDRPGGAVYVFFRVGRAVLATSQGGEWTRESTRRGARRLVSRDADLVTAMQVFGSEER